MSDTETLYAIYEEGGQYAVYDWVRENRPAWPWTRCEPCEDITPTDDDGDCAVCATPKEKE
jgi:hypothetical protein